MTSNRISSAFRHVAGFTHPPLEDASAQMRLFQFLPDADTGSLIKTTLSVWHRTGAPPYIALSYTWGAASQKKMIHVDDTPLLVSSNCWRALHRLRRRGPPSQYFWIDALCVDQSNNEEKSLQVRAMGDVFRQAESVWADLDCSESSEAGELPLMFEKLEQMKRLYPDGMEEVKFAKPLTPVHCGGVSGVDATSPADEPVCIEEVLFESAKPRLKGQPARWYWVEQGTNYAWEKYRIEGPVGIYEMCFPQLTVDDWKGLCQDLVAFDSLVYWNRIWTVQEVVVAESLKLLYKGRLWQSYLINALCLELECHFQAWANLAATGNATEKRGRELNCHPAETKIVRELQPFLVKVRSLAMVRTMWEKYNTIDRTTCPLLLGQWDKRARTPIAVLRDYEKSGCFDPRDRVFAMRELARWRTDVGPIEADYSMSLADLALVLMKNGIGHNTSRSMPHDLAMMIICRVLGLRRKSPDMVVLREQKGSFLPKLRTISSDGGLLSLRERKALLLKYCPESPTDLSWLG